MKCSQLYIFSSTIWTGVLQIKYQCQMTKYFSFFVPKYQLICNTKSSIECNNYGVILKLGGEQYQSKAFSLW